jgi:hypothetical protein
MNMQELTTWNRLLALDLDAADAALPFSARLARDNGWPQDFATRATEEYRKFCFLAVHAGHPVTPSDEVDQVWHLHLLYSQHYWDALCRDALGMPLHHGPTAGGAAEGRKYRSWYERTLESYRRFFGEPPNDLWPTSSERFHEQHDFVRIDRRDVVTLDRATLKRGALAAIAGGGVLTVAHALAQTDGAANPGAGMLIFVVVALVAVLAIGFIRSRRPRNVDSRRSAAQKRRAAADGAAVGGVGGAGCSSHPKGPGGDHASTDGGANGCGTASGCSGGGGCGGGGS